MTDEQREDVRSDDVSDDIAPSPRNPFDESPEDETDNPAPVLFGTQRSAAILGVVVGLVALFFVIAICVAASFAFG